MANAIDSVIKNVLKVGVKAPLSALWGAFKNARSEFGVVKGAGKVVEGAAKSVKDQVPGFEKAFMATPAGKIFGATGRLGGATGRFLSRNPVSKALTSNWIKIPAIGTAAVAGLMYGGGKSKMDSMNRRTASMDNRGGMSSNNLGTDGLTLALSKMRHR